MAGRRVYGLGVAMKVLVAGGRGYARVILVPFLCAACYEADGLGLWHLHEGSGPGAL